jgi:probable phosphomutase (TIGR03848 family)
MATVLLVRHGRTTANASGVLAGRAPGVHLDATGVAQADQAGARIAALNLQAIVSSPLGRCRETARAIVSRSSAGETPAVSVDARLTECDYGDWQGRSLKELAKEPLWKQVQGHPASVTFPGGEGMATLQARAVAAIRERDDAIEQDAGAGALWVAVSHGDVIKAILADALGTHLDHFQRLQVDPASISIVRYTSARPYILGLNTHEGSLAWLAGSGHKRARRGAAIGGGAGPNS